MKENSTFLIIKDRKFLIEDITILDNGEISYSIYSLSDITEQDKEYIHDSIYKILGLSWN